MQRCRECPARAGSVQTRRVIYKLLQIWATLFFLTIHMSCAKVPPTQPGDIEAQGTPNPFLDQQTDPPSGPQKEPFNITIAGLDTLPILSWQRTSIKEAVTVWEEIITEGLPDVGGVDDLYLGFLWSTSTDRLASGWYDWQSRRHGSHLPYVGFVRFHSPMLESRFDREDWKKVAVHEIAHALGFSWFMFTDTAGTEVIGGTHYFKGERATHAYRQILYENGEKLAYAIPNLRVPLTDFGSHWNAEAVKWDLMSPYYFNGSVLTSVTIQAMADIGYTVDDSQAESPATRLFNKPALPHYFYCDGQHTHLVTSP